MGISLKIKLLKLATMVIITSAAMAIAIKIERRL